MAQDNEFTDVNQADSSGDGKDATRKGVKLYGSNFPGKTRNGTDWRKWITDRMSEQNGVMRDKRLHWTRHRHFRQGRQWISTRDGRTWREPQGDKNSIRAVLDQIGPAIDFRLAIITEQKPGFRTHPLGTGISAKETAEAQQALAEHYYNKQNGLKLLTDAKSNAYTDGVAFLHVFVDKNAGPTREDVELIPPGDQRFEMMKAQGYEVGADGLLRIGLAESGDHMPLGEETREFPTGDIATRVVMASEVFVDAEAKTVNGPYDRAKWLIIRRIRDLSSARIETGNPNLEADSTSMAVDPVLDAIDFAGTPSTSGGYSRGLPPFPASRFRSRVVKESVFDYLVYIAPAAEAGNPDGLWRRIIGNKVVAGDNELPGGKIPIARITDGSTDPEFYPRPVMSTWINDQLSINALWSKLLEHARIFGTGRVMAQKGTLITETYSNIVASVLEYTGAKPEYLPGTRAAGDTWQQLEMAIKMIQDKTGWNDLARGQVTGSGSFSDVSGRALLGARELFERNFSLDIRAAAMGMSDWSTLIVDYARWLFDEPRMIPITGRGDLAKKIEGKDLGEENVVYVDPETLTPLPRALRNQMLFDLLQQGLITINEYKRRAPFAEIRNVHFGEQGQWERAQWINTFLEENWQTLSQVQFIERYAPGVGAPVWWQDDPTTHQMALEEIIHDERKPVQLRDIASERWGLYDQLNRTKVPDPTTGQVVPLDEPLALVARGVPLDMLPQAQPPQPIAQIPEQPGPGGVAQAIGAQPPGTPGSPPAPGNVGSAGAPQASAIPNAGPVAVPQQQAPALGEFGAVERRGSDLPPQ